MQNAATPPFKAEPMGFFTDVTLCIGCKACEVACKEWNQLPATNGGRNELSGESYDNTRKLDGEHWRHVTFVEDINDDRSQMAWRMLSDVCKHCVQAGCLEVCPTGAIIRTEYDTVVIQNDVCNGCRACIAACPFDVIDINFAPPMPAANVPAWIAARSAMGTCDHEITGASAATIRAPARFATA